MPVTSLLKPSIKQWFDKSAASELYARNLYQYLGNQMQRMGFFGVQKYFLHESKEEGEHYQKLADFVNDMGDILSVPMIENINEQVGSMMDALKISYETELDFMKQYQKFYEDAEESGDCVSATFIIEYLQQQRKSVGMYGDLIARLEKNMSDVFQFDNYVSELIEA